QQAQDPWRTKLLHLLGGPIPLAIELVGNTGRTPLLGGKGQDACAEWGVITQLLPALHWADQLMGGEGSPYPFHSYEHAFTLPVDVNDDPRQDLPENLLALPDCGGGGYP